MATTHPFEVALSVPTEELEFELRGHCPAPWADFLLNPRRLRGSDFLMRWSQGRWSEERVIQGINETDRYFAVPYGPSGTAPDNPRDFELYFERLEKAGLGQVKRPDLLIFRRPDQGPVQRAVDAIGGVQQLPFTPETDTGIRHILAKAVLAVECENSLWIASQMPGFGSELQPQKRLGGQPGLKKTAVVPTVILKEEDRAPLRDWQGRTSVPLHIWHVFYDMAFGLPFDSAEQLIREGKIEPTIQTFQAPGGATTRKPIYKFYYHYAYPLGNARQEPRLVADHITDKNGHILPYVRFEDGSFEISNEAIRVLDSASRRER